MATEDDPGRGNLEDGDLTRALDTALEGERGLAGIVYLCAIDAAEPPDVPAPSADEAFRVAQERQWGRALSVAQRFAHDGGRAAPRLWFVTRGAQAVTGEELVSVAQAPVWGLGRTVALECPGLRATCVDLDPAGGDETSMLADELVGSDGDQQLAFRDGRRQVARLVRVEDQVAEHSPTAPAMAASASADSHPADRMVLTSTEAGTFDTLVWVRSSRPAPVGNEVEIRVEAAGLNFRDVLSVLGLYPGDAGPLGGECAGIISRIGPDVGTLAPGDRVVAIASGSFATFTLTDARLVARIGPVIETVAAATIPIAFLTASFALGDVGRLGPGDRVLIHAATGGVGTAAVQVARAVGAEVLATAGSVRKRAILEGRGVRDVFDSRSLTFADQVMERTGGEGVDVVLNSLTGEFIEKGLSTLRSGGRFVEIGKRDLRSARHRRGHGR